MNLTAPSVLFVVPHAGTWIEIRIRPRSNTEISVVPHAGTWIEIQTERQRLQTMKSFPTRERGLKYTLCGCEETLYMVVPHAGTWIEIENCEISSAAIAVVPHAGTWIEIAY